MLSIITSAGIAATAAVLISASVQDIRSREVSDVHWCIIGIVGMIVMISEMFRGPDVMWRAMVCAGTAMILWDILCGRDRSPKIAAALFVSTVLMFAIPAACSGDQFTVSSLSVLICYAIILVLFRAGVIKGGADAKCLISLSILFPVYPEFEGFPVIAVPDTLVSVVMSFPMAVLFNASLLTIFFAVPMILRNIVRGDTEVPNMFLGYRTDQDNIKKMHVWIMEGGRTPEAGERIWVIPKVPFIVPITISVFFVMFAGNILFLF